MRYLALALTLICGSAQATNVFYYPIMDQVTGLPNVLYLTDESNDKCPSYMMVAKLETDDKKVLNTLCWARDRNNLENTLLLNLSNGQITSNYIPYGISKGAGDAYRAIMKKWLAENEATTKIMNSCEFLRPRGFKCDADREKEIREYYAAHPEELIAQEEKRKKEADLAASAKEEALQKEAKKKEINDYWAAEEKKREGFGVTAILSKTPISPLVNLFTYRNAPKAQE